MKFDSFQKRQEMNLDHKVKCGIISYAARVCGVFGGVAQLGERTVRIRKVESSILFVSTTEQRSEAIRAFECFLIFKITARVFNLRKPIVR